MRKRINQNQNHEQNGTDWEMEMDFNVLLFCWQLDANVMKCASNLSAVAFPSVMSK